MLSYRNFLSYAQCGFVISTLGCSLASAVSVASTPSPAPTATSAPLYQQVTLTSRSSSETGQPFAYSITLETPELVGSNDPRLLAFNAEMASIVASAASDFKTSLLNVPPTPVSAGSSFAMRYELRAPLGPVISLQFEIDGYVTGAAHPFHVTRSVNFDLESGRDIALSDLFTPGSDYLQVISDYCIAQLKSRGIDSSDFSLGAAPTPDNYRNWNITPSGLQITFDEYQVAAYALGPQIVLIPYPQLISLIKDPGPLSPYLH